MRVILLGGAGYIGSVIGADLAGRGHDVVIVDDLIYLTEKTWQPSYPAAFIRGDIRDEELLHSVMPGADAIVHLGGLVGEPASAIDEPLSVELNFSAPVLAGEIARAAGVPRYVFLSSCSVYGRQEGLVTEETPPNPLACYAQTKLAAEQRLTEILDNRTSLAVLRLATVFGLSPRMRLDSVVNSMTARAAATGRIPLRGGSAWRPLVHVRDVAGCVRRIVEDDVRREPDAPLVLNVGDDANNGTIAEIAERVASRVAESSIDVEGQVIDHRDYRVSFARIAELMPGACETSLDAGIDEIAAAVRDGAFTDPTAVEHDNLRGLRAALEGGRIASIRTEAMRRLAKEYESCTDSYREDAAARYWGEVRLDSVPVGDAAAEDAAVLCAGKPTAVSSAYAQWELDCLDAMLPDLAGKRVVDLGCGVGRILAQLAPRCGAVTGVDLAPGMAARARARVADRPNADVIVAGIADVPLPAASVDAVVCVGVFEHISGPQRDRALAEIGRLLRPRGQVLLELNNAGSALLSHAHDDNPHRLGMQLDNGYFCELVDIEATVAAAERHGLTVADRRANPFYSSARHGIDGGVADGVAELFSHARRLDQALGHAPILGMLADQHMLRLVKHDG